MASVTQRIKMISQPYGGYLPVKSFSKETLHSDDILNEEENIHTSLIGLAVDYLTRFMLGEPVEKAFHISFLGAKAINLEDVALSLMAKIQRFDDTSIINACKLVGFDVCYRATLMGYKPVELINPDSSTIENIRIMVKRSLLFLKRYGPVVCSEPVFTGGYTDTVDTGDGDFITADTLWDFKVSKNAPTSKHTLQLLMYYIMGMHSTEPYFQGVTHLGIFNPRLNVVYRCAVSDIPKETIEEVEQKVIRYGVSIPTTNKPAEQTETALPRSYIDDIYYTVNDLCKISKLSKSYIYNEIHSGRLQAVKEGRGYRIKREEILRYFRERVEEAEKNGFPRGSKRYTVASICEKTGLSKSSVYADIRGGHLHAVKAGNKYIISENDANAYFELLEKRRENRTRVITGVSIAVVVALLLFWLLFTVSR